MKFVVLVDSGSTCYDEMVDVVADKDPFLVNTKHCDAVNEYRYLQNSIETFLHSDYRRNVMLASFSGRERITKDIGDKSSGMILTISENKESKYYTGCPIKTLRDLINIFDKETV